jgi:hypothetical protein
MALLVGGVAVLVLGVLVTLRPDLPSRTPAIVVPIAAALAAVAMALGETAPTGWAPFDLLLRAGFGALVVLSAAVAPVGVVLWLALVTAASLVVADAGAWEAVGAVGIALLLVLAISGRQPGLQALGAAAAVAPLAHLDWPLATGASALAVVVATMPVLVAGLGRAGRSTRRAVGWSVAVAALVVVVGGVVGGLSALGARSDVDRAVDAALSGLDQVSSDDTAPAIAELEEAEAAFASAESTLRAWWARPALLVPGVAQQSRAVATMADAGADLSAVAADSLAEADLDRLQPSEGQVDLVALEEIDAPLQEAAASLATATDRLDDVDSPLLLPPVADRLDELSLKVDEARTTAQTAADVLDVAPGLLGADGPRRYFLVMHTPSELRGVGGFMGSWGELVVDQGRFDLARTGRLSELTQGGPDPAGRRIEGQPEFVARYGQAPAQYWGQIAYSPDFPTVASVIEELYPQSGGSEIDGVIAVDPAAFARFVELSGPIQVPGYPEQLSSENAEQVLLHDQYLAFEDDDGDDREGFLQEATEVLFDRLTTGALPSPRVIAEELSPAVAGRHLQMFAMDPDEQALFEQIGADGSVAREDVDAVGVVGQNFNGNKIDYFLRRHLTYDVEWDPATGAVEGTVEVELQNLAPASGLPGSVISWGGDLSLGQTPVADGENLSLVSLYSALPLSGLTLDGEPVEPLRTGTELGYQVADLYVLLPPGGTRTLRAEVRGQTDPGRSYSLELLRQPTATPDRLDVRVRLAPGWELPDGATELVRSSDTSAPFRVDVAPRSAEPTLLERLRGRDG